MRLATMRESLMHGTGTRIGRQLLAFAVRRFGSRLTLSAVAGLLVVAALVALPLVALAQTPPSAELSALSLSSGTLRPTFAPTTTEYRAAVKHNVDQITVTATAAGGVTVETTWTLRTSHSPTLTPMPPGFRWTS